MHTRGKKMVEGFKGVNFSLARGEFLSLQGVSGCGKSSIMKAIYRTYKSTSGDILFYSSTQEKMINLAKASDSEILQIRKDDMGYVSQFLQILPRVSALQAVSEPLIQKGELESSAIEKAKEMLDFFSIKEELFNLSPLTFSGGEQQRINIAKGIIAPKNLLLLDEPTASLDKENTLKVIQKLQELKKKQIAMIGIFHNQQTMELISDKIYEVRKP